MFKSGWYRRFCMIAVIPFLIFGLMLSAFPVSAAEVFPFDDLAVTYVYGQLINNQWVNNPELGSSLLASGTYQSVVRFGLSEKDNITNLAKIPVSSDLSDIFIYGRFSVDSGSPVASGGSLAIVLRVKCYNSVGSLLSTVLRVSYSNFASEYLSVSGVEFPLGTTYFTVEYGLGGYSGGTEGGLYGLKGSYSCSCALTLVTGDGSFVSDKWGTDNPYPFLFSHENQNIYLEKNGRIDFFVAVRGFNNLSMHVIARTYADTIKFDLVYSDNLNYVLLSAVPPDTDQAAILCFDFYIQGNFVYTAPACAIYFSGWEGSETPGDSGGGTLDGDLLTYLEELKISQDEAEKQIEVLQSTVDKLLSEIEGTEDQKEQADAFGQKTEEQLGQIQEDVNAMDQITVPDIGNIDLNIDNQVSGDGMSAMAMLLGIMMNSQTVATSMTFAFLFSLVAYVIFGKR